MTIMMMMMKMFDDVGDAVGVKNVSPHLTLVGPSAYLQRFKILQKDKKDCIRWEILKP